MLHKSLLALFPFPCHFLGCLQLIKAGCPRSGFIGKPFPGIIASRYASFLVVGNFNHLICALWHWPLSRWWWCFEWARFGGGPWKIWQRQALFLDLAHLFLSLHLSQFCVFIHGWSLFSAMVRNILATLSCFICISSPVIAQQLMR